jgi:hypothetical protein
MMAESKDAILSELENSVKNLQEEQAMDATKKALSMP